MPKITISVEYDNTEDAILGLSALRGGDNVATGAARIPVKDKTKAADPKPDSATKTDTPAASSPDAKSAAPAAGTSTAASSGDAYAAVSAAISGAVKTHRPQVLETLTAFGAKSGKDLKPEQYDDFLAKLAAVIAPAEDLS